MEKSTLPAKFCVQEFIHVKMM